MCSDEVSEHLARHVVAEPDDVVERDDGCAEYLAIIEDRRIEVVLDMKTNPPKGRDRLRKGRENPDEAGSHARGGLGSERRVCDD